MSALLTTAKDKNGADVKIEDAISGKKCGCFCPICGNPLIAKNRIPKERAKHEHHFAHKKGCLCEANDETILHQYAKDILVEEKALMLPIAENDDRPSGLVHFRSVEKEKWDAEFGFRPDIDAILDNGERLIIEFYVSHKVSGKKRNLIVKNKLNCIEIDLNYVNIDKEDIRSFLLEDSDNRNWISAPEKKGESKDCFSFPSPNPWREKAIEFLKERLKNCDIDIRRYSETHNLAQL